MTEKINQTILSLVQKELAEYHEKQLATVLNLLSEGNTVPFIARYRKEMTGSLDEVQIREIEERYAYLENLEKRKTEVIRLIDEQGKLTPELQKSITQAVKMQQVEDLYRPYKQKRRTKATIAKEKGLEPFALWLLRLTTGDVQEEASKYLTEEVPTVEEALQGAHEIIAEQISDNASFRTWIRSYTYNKGLYESTVKDADIDEKGVYEMYYEFSEPVHKIVSHRILATNRGEKEEVLKVSLKVDEAAIFGYLEKQLISSPDSPAALIIQNAYQDSYKRFIQPAIEREIRNELTEKADEQAIAIFGENLRNLLLQPPLKGKVVLGFDPAYRTGCKLAVVDATGKILAIEVIYPHKPAPQAKRVAAGPSFVKLIDQYKVDMVAIGNGTASRESELFVAEQLKSAKQKAYYAIVNEAGASVYSASDIARKEFPDLQVEERSAISIARRLQDPLAELVKIDPKAVGVGQYQHDVSQKRLAEQLDFVVETAVNQVGVDVNTASPQLLQHISGLNKTTAQNIVTFREENGEFVSRTQLKKVPRLGPKAYEQAVGFLRVPGGKHVLDNTGIHPESYPVAKEILKANQLSEKDLGSKEAIEKLTRLSVSSLAKQVGTGEETLKDILEGLTRPGRDMRDEMPAPMLRSDVLSMEDLKPGMELKGTVRNVIDFGAFVDIGVKQDGLVHISKLSNKFVKHPTDVVSVGDVVTVWIDQVDTAKGRISLTMRSPYEEKA
ncbi:RNA-binding transcriptional accessory protein [Enterococcus hirae]|nr:RNA-binding transcriptional accessory protein [Enterococcus hirae]